ncbi:hypothetical protein GC197_03250 [bacterium]|nr:hypothetical protein [bacterium]
MHQRISSLLLAFAGCFLGTIAFSFVANAEEFDGADTSQGAVVSYQDKQWLAEIVGRRPSPTKASQLTSDVVVFTPIHSGDKHVEFNVRRLKSKMLVSIEDVCNLTLPLGSVVIIQNARSISVANGRVDFGGDEDDERDLLMEQLTELLETAISG